MHPILILIPAALLALGPRLWVRRILDRYAGEDPGLPLSGAQVARQLLDQHGLQAVSVEPSDIGDHYDAKARSVRLTRDKFDSHSLTAVTTAAHEVGHALQHATDFAPFMWRGRLVQVATSAGEVGSVLLLAVPLSALMSKQPMPPKIVGGAALAMLGTGVAAQLAALPTEFDASFERALPMLQQGYVDGGQLADAKQILLACSLTYVASSLTGVLNIWPWLGRGPVVAPPHRVQLHAGLAAVSNPRRRVPAGSGRRPGPGLAAGLVRQYGKPLIKALRRRRDWLS